MGLKPDTPDIVPGHATPRPATRPAEVEAAERLPSSAFGHFVLVREVGRGGMGAVYRAWDRNVGRFVALKVILGSNPESIERFMREAQIAGRLEHPAIATVYEAGEAAGKHYIAMQFIDGAPIDRQARPIDKTLALIRDVARALDYAHAQGVIHRDIKPGNILVDREGAAYLTDFGTAKEVQADLGSQISLTGYIVGTPQYMSPEQAHGDSKKVDARCDVYSLGATLFALLAGRPPFDSRNIGELLVMLLKKRPPRLGQFNAAASPELQDLIDRTLAKNPAHRPQSAGAFADELDRLLRERRYVGRYGLPRYLARRWWPWVAGAAALGLAIRLSAPAFVRAPDPGGATLTRDERYRVASQQLAAIEREGAAARRDEMRKLLVSLEDLDSTPARVLRARAFYVDGRRDDARRAVAELSDQSKRDYRIPFLRALLAIEDELAKAPPLPATGGPPGGEVAWDTAPAPWPSSVRDDLSSVVTGERADAQQYAQDATAAAGLMDLAEGRWAAAASKLDRYVRGPSLPVLVRAWCRAAYLAGQFGPLLHHAATATPRERFGARLATGRAAEAEPDATGDGEATALLCVHRAWAALDAGDDPEPHVARGVAAVPAGHEYRGALLACRARRQSMAGTAPAADEALKALAEPRTWVGRRGRVDALLALGGPEDLKRAVEACGVMLQPSREWAVPRVMRGWAHLRSGRLDDAMDDVGSLPSSTAALLAGAAVRLRIVEERRRVRADFADVLRKARACINEVLESYREHPEALNLAAVADLIEAEERGGDASAAVALLDRALSRVPGYVDALVHRAAARLLAGDRARAVADLDAALKAAPERHAARLMRGIAHFQAGRAREAVADWKSVIAGDAKLDTPELRAWIRRAEGMTR